MKGRLYHGYIDLDGEGQKELPYWIKLALSYNQELTQQNKKMRSAQMSLAFLEVYSLSFYEIQIYS